MTAAALATSFTCETLGENCVRRSKDAKYRPQTPPRMPFGAVILSNSRMFVMTRTSLVLEARTATLRAREDPAPFFLAVARAIPDGLSAQVIIMITVIDKICKIRSLRCWPMPVTALLRVRNLYL